MNQNYIDTNKYPNKIKVFIFIDSYHIGGLHRQMLNLVKHINRNLFDPIICTQTSNGGLKKEFEKVGCKLYDLKWKRKFDFSTVYRLVKVLYSERPDIIFIPQAQTFFYYRLARLFWHGKIVQIGSFRALNFLNGHLKSYFTPFDNLFSKWLLSSSYRVIVNSKAMKNHYTQFIKKGGQNTIEIINNGSNFSYPILKLPATIRQELNLSLSDFIVVMAARLDPWKDFTTLFKAAKIIIKKEPLVRFLIIGEGPLRQKLEQMIFEMDINKNIFLVGEKKDIYNYFNVSDISVLSTNGEGFSNTILESMAMGKPVIASDVGGNSEVIGDCGFIIPPKSPKLFAEAILKLKRDKILLNKIGEAAKERVHQICDINKYISSYETLFLRAMDKGK
jgi:glycosyltransferase involved in cell wall biosynthesis